MDSLIKEKAKYQVDKTLYETGHTFMQFSPFGRVLFLVFLIGIVPGYFLAKYSARGYYNQAYKSSRLEAKPASVLASDLEIGQVQVFTVGSSAYSALVKVKNPNLDISVAASPYKLSLYDDLGNLVNTTRGELYLLPNGETNIIASRIESANKIVTGKLEIESPKFQKRITLPEVDLQAGTPIWFNQDTPPGFVVEGSVYNNSPYLLGELTLKIILFDKTDRILGVSARSEFSVNPFERRAYKNLWSGVFTNEVAKVLVIPETNVLASSNLQLQFQDRPGLDQ